MGGWFWLSDAVLGIFHKNSPGDDAGSTGR
jgi:hypothetical protein